MLTATDLFDRFLTDDGSSALTDVAWDRISVTSKACRLARRAVSSADLSVAFCLQRLSETDLTTHRRKRFEERLIEERAEALALTVEAHAAAWDDVEAISAWERISGKPFTR